MKCSWVLTVLLDLLYKSRRVAHGVVVNANGRAKMRRKKKKIEIPMAMDAIGDDEIRFLFMGDWYSSLPGELIGNRKCFVVGILMHAQKKAMNEN